MRRALLTTAATASGVVMLLSFKPHHSAGASAVPAPPPGPSGGTGSRSGAGSAGPTPGPSPSRGPGTARSGGAHRTRTVTGPSVPTRWGPVRVRVSLTGRRITAVDVLQRPDGNDHSREINSQAVPRLVQETLSAQSARIDAVSGASYTSAGYVSSLQSALDRAGG